MRPPTRTFIFRFLLLVFFLSLAACGGSSSGPDDPGNPGGNNPPDVSNPPADATPPGVEIVFPASRVITEAAATLIVRGHATDNVAVTAVRLNGVLAETNDAFANWSLRVPLESGANRIEVLARDAAGNEKSAEAEVQNAAFLPDAFIDIAWDADARRLFAVSYDGRIVVLEVESGEWRTLADAQHGSGVPFEPVRKVLWDAERARLLALPRENNNDDLLAIDVESGERTMQPDFFESHVYDWQFDSVRDRLIVRYDIAFQSEGLQAIDPATGAHEMLVSLIESSLSREFTYDPASNRAWFYEHFANAIVEVIIDTGDVLTISDDDLDNDPGTVDPRGEGDSLFRIYDLALANDGADLLVLVSPNSSATRLMRVDIGSGDRSVFSESGVRGEGPSFVDNGGLLTGETDDAIWFIDEGAAGADGIVRVDPVTGDRLPVRDGTFAAGLGPDLGPVSLRGSAFDAERQELLFAGGRADNAIAVDIASGDRRIVSDRETGDGPFLSNPADVGFDAAAGNVWVSERSPTFLNKVNPETGDREVIRLLPEGNETVPSGFAYRFALHPVANRAYVIDNTLERIYSVDLATGLYSVLTDPDPDKDPDTDDAIGAGDDLLVTGDALLDIANNRLILNGNDRVQAVDLGTGDRTTLLHTTDHPRLMEGGDATLGTNNTLAVPSRLEAALLRVNPVTGERSEISDAHMDYEGTAAVQRGTGPAFLWPASAQLVSTAPEILAVFDSARNAVFLVDGETGDRVILSR
ncbi:MAG TPA: hypothetical protein VF275_10140 [Gammaproteobacteria bacterium]